MKKIGPCKVLQKILDTAYVLDFLEEFDISPTFNVVYLYRDHEGVVDKDFFKDWKDQIPEKVPKKIVEVISERSIRRIRWRKMMEYLVKWTN